MREAGCRMFFQSSLHTWTSAASRTRANSSPCTATLDSIQDTTTRAAVLSTAGSFDAVASLSTSSLAISKPLIFCPKPAHRSPFHSRTPPRQPISLVTVDMTLRHGARAALGNDRDDATVADTDVPQRQALTTPTEACPATATATPLAVPFVVNSR